MRRVWTSLKYRLEYAGFTLAAFILRSMSVETASNLSGWLWRHLAPRFRRHERALLHLERAFPEKTHAEREAIARAMWENMGRTFGEAFHLAEIASSGRIIMENPEVLRRWTAIPGGKVACTGHLANWELAAFGAKSQGLKPWGMYQRIKNPYVNREVARMRSPLFTGGLVQKSASVPRLFLRVVREGGAVGFLSDLREFGGVEVPFFGMPAPTTTFPALLARSVETPVLMARLRRLPGVRFVHSYEIVDTPVTDDRKADILATTVNIQATLERYIRDAPEQWMWAHRRWG